ncbi:hypothetical protein [Phenylobacterium sp.]|uniref:hypothetical protein n=1 Tax=Phenylobacterium sp. TaxID=1871053 RepID=UPI002600824E|nr:hypothetical protein [Phenylobacterium sp.]
MSKSVPAAALCAGLALALPHTAAAQSGFLKNLARQAAAAAIQNSAQPSQAQTVAPGAADDGGGSGGDVSAPAAEATPATTGPAPWPMNAGARSVKYPSDLRFSPELDAQKKAFVEFGKVRCSDCEGGYSYDAWARQLVSLDGSYNAFEKKLGGLALGQRLTWKGAQSLGSITVVSEEAVNGWPCKQLKWELKKGQQSAERPGLLCYGKASSYSGSDSWIEVF